MAVLTAYQTQARRRIRKALKMRLKADFKVRALGARLQAALANAATAAARITALNALYGTAYVGASTLVTDMSTAGIGAALGTAAAASLAGSPEQLYAVVANLNPGFELPANPVLD